MGNLHAKSRKKRQAEHRSCSKKQRPRQPDEPKSAVKIIDLNDDCLVKIFGHLDFQNLFNVSVANEWLRPAASDVYKRKFGTKPLRIYGIASETTSPTERSTFIAISSLKACLHHLRFFGSSINKVALNFNQSTAKQYQYVTQYINNYCGDTLIELELLSKPSGNSIDNFSKPFNNVRKVIIWDCHLGEQFPSFAEWFPNLHRLELNFVRLMHAFDQVSFGHLAHLVTRASSRNEFGIHDAANLLHSNKQLRSLEISNYNRTIKMKKLLDIIQNNPMIYKLAVKFNSHAILIHSAEVQRIIKEHSSLVELGLPCHQFANDDVITLMSQLESLKVIEFKLQDDLDHGRFVRLNSNWTSSQVVSGFWDGQNTYLIELKPNN